MSSGEELGRGEKRGEGEEEFEGIDGVGVVVFFEVSVELLGVIKLIFEDELLVWFMAVSLILRLGFFAMLANELGLGVVGS